MDKYQAARLESVLKKVGKEDCKLVALMGGDRFFSTGNSGQIVYSSYLI